MGVVLRGFVEGALGAVSINVLCIFSKKHPLFSNHCP